jgi:leucyl-tRNA synthetase
LGSGGSVVYADFPSVDKDLLVADTVELPVQVNGKVRARITVATDAGEDALITAALAEPRIVQILDGIDPRKIVAVPNRAVSIVQ